MGMFLLLIHLCAHTLCWAMPKHMREPAAGALRIRWTASRFIYTWSRSLFHCGIYKEASYHFQCLLRSADNGTRVQFILQPLHHWI